MLKQMLPLLFTLIFSINLFAESHDIHREISDIKLQIQEIKLTDARDEREKKLEKLEKDIKELEEKFNQNNIDKKEIEKKFDNNKDILDRQDKRIEDISSNLNYWGIGFSLIAIFTGLAVFLVNKNYADSAKKEALISVYEWMEKNKDRIVEPIINEGNNLLRNIRKEADVLLQDYQSTMKNHNLKNELDSKEKDILEKVNILLESKETENYTFNDWISKALDYFYKKDFNNSIKALDNAIKLTTKEIEIAMALINKGITFNQMDGKSEEAIKVYDQVVRKFEDSKDSDILIQVAVALLNKGFSFGQIDGKLEKAIEVYDEVIRRFSNSNDNRILEKVASALLNKIEMNLILGNTNSKKDLDLYFNLIKENKEQLLKFEMIQILEKAKEFNQDGEINQWQMKFKDTKLGDWSFNELKTWAETLEDKTKEKVLRYIDIFENHNKNI